YLEGDVPYRALNAADEKNRQGSEIIFRDDLGQWLSTELERVQAEARKRGEPIPSRLPSDMPLLNVPKGLLRILNRDLIAAGIPKKEERGRTLEVHAIRTTFGTLLSKGALRRGPRKPQCDTRTSA